MTPVAQMRGLRPERLSNLCKVTQLVYTPGTLDSGLSIWWLSILGPGRAHWGMKERDKERDISVSGICAVMEVVGHCPGCVCRKGYESTWEGQGRLQKERVMKAGRVQRVCRTPSGRVGSTLVGGSSTCKNSGGREQRTRMEVCDSMHFWGRVFVI